MTVIRKGESILSFRQTEPLIELNSRAKKVQDNYFDLLNKPVEVYLFLDPICPDSWIIDPYIIKLQLEYGRYFTIRPILSSNRNLLNDTQVLYNYPDFIRERELNINQKPKEILYQYPLLNQKIQYPEDIFYAIKAAELQGIKAGRRYLRKVQESLFLNQSDISVDEGLIDIALQAKLDVEEFKNDLHSASAKKALQCDLKVSREMEVDQAPSIVFFSESEEEEGLKISGTYDYDVYVKVLETLLQKEIKPFKKPSLEKFMSFYHFISSEEIAIIYDWTLKKAQCEMKKLQLKQLVKQVSVNSELYWRYLED